MITVTDSQSLTNQLLIDELELWELFDSKSISDDKTKRYYQLIDDLIDTQIGESIAWLKSDAAKEYFFQQVELEKEIFDALEDSWDDIFDNSYEKVDDLLDAIYDEGKKQGYSQMKETVRYTDADIQAIRLAKDYNYHLIQSLTGDLQSTVKNKILQGIITGENPYNLSRTLQKAGVTPLDGSPFTARQRATMIAKTETSRMQNTGMVQSYLNEGFVEVKLLTAEDKDVCTTCLEYAYKFNKDEPRVFSPELLEREKVHSIVSLIKGGRFPPFHPHCRCTYLTVWETKTDPPSNPPVINLTPLSVTVRKQEEDLPEPTKEQLMKNLRPAEREKYDSCKRNIPRQRQWLKDNPDAPAEEIAKHQKRLAFLEKKFLELKKKALGADANVPVKKPKTPKKPVSDKPKPKTPVEKPTDKPNKPQEPINVTRGQLEEGLNETELKEYDDIVKRIEKINKWLANDPLSHGFIPSDIDNQQEILKRNKERLEELKRKATTPKPEVETPKVDTPTDKPKKPVEKPQTEEPSTNVNLNETIDDLRKIVPLSDEAFDEILKWSKKRVKNKTRFGREYNTTTGEFTSRETKGREGICQFTTVDSPDIIRITSMGKNSDGIPSSTDFKLTRAGKNQDFLYVSKNEIWYIHTTENYGHSSIITSQKDIDDICRNASREARAEVMELVKQGKLSRDDISALQETQKKIESDKVLKAFSTKEWQDKGFIVHRAKRDDIKTTTRKSSKPNTRETVDVAHIDTSKLTYDNLKTPEEVAAFYDLEYIPEVNAKGKIVSQKFIDHMTYVDPKTGETINHKLEIVFDSTFVGPNRRKAKDLIDITNSGECKYDQKELIRIVKEAPEIYKFATGSINFAGVDRYTNRRFAWNELGNATWYRSHEFKNGKYFLKGVNSIMIPYLPLNTPHGSRGTVQQTLYHEMSHCFDYSLMKGEALDLLIKGTTTGLSRNEIMKLNDLCKYGYGHGVSNDKSWRDTKKTEHDYQGENNYPQEGASWYGTIHNDPEHWAETGSMAAISLTGRLTDAVMEDYRHKSVQWDDWSKYHKHTLDYAINKIKSVKPSDLMYNSNVGVKTVKPKKEKVSKPKKETKPKTDNKLNPLERGKVKKITYEEYPHLEYKAPKVIEYEDGTVIKFKSKVTNPDAPDWTEQTIDEITINGKTIKYKNTEKIYDDFEYQDKQLTKDELAFADEFIKHYGTFAGQQFNSYQMGRLSKKDYDEIKDDVSFKWLVKNADRYDELLDKTEITEDVVTCRVKWHNHVKESDKYIQDNMYTSSSAGVPRTSLIDMFANARDIPDNWTYITVTPKGTKGARFQGNSIARNEGSRDDDFEKEITYKRNFKFDIVLFDPKNKIIILEPGR